MGWILKEHHRPCRCTRRTVQRRCAGIRSVMLLAGTGRAVPGGGGLSPLKARHTKDCVRTYSSVTLFFGQCFFEDAHSRTRKVQIWTPMSAASKASKIDQFASLKCSRAVAEAVKVGSKPLSVRPRASVGPALFLFEASAVGRRWPFPLPSISAFRPAGLQRRFNRSMSSKSGRFSSARPSVARRKPSG